MTVGQFDYPKAGTFKYHPNTKWYSPHRYDMHVIKAAHYCAQYIKWQKQVNDPALIASNKFAEEWEICGKYL